MNSNQKLTQYQNLVMNVKFKITRFWNRVPKTCQQMTFLLSCCDFDYLLSLLLLFLITTNILFNSCALWFHILFLSNIFYNFKYISNPKNLKISLKILEKFPARSGAVNYPWSKIFVAGFPFQGILIPD